MSEQIVFSEFPKIPRWSRRIIVTEKIDGTNCVVYVPTEGPILAGSRTRWIPVEADHYGFARWVKEHETELRELGVGYHHGEWWGQGINRGYGLNEKRWSLINSTKWRDERPSCCHVVPILYDGIMSESEIVNCLGSLRTKGSVAAPGFMRPEGVVIFHVQGNLFFKKTLEHDEQPKSSVTLGKDKIGRAHV